MGLVIDLYPHFLTTSKGGRHSPPSINLYFVGTIVGTRSLNLGRGGWVEGGWGQKVLVDFISIL
jgi:hypothetical protein